MYGYKWIEAEGRYVVGSQTNGLFMQQPREMQPVGHWVRGTEREFREAGMYTWEPGPFERLSRRLKGWRWYPYRKVRQQLQELT